MIAVIFEVWPASGQRDEYLRLAADLRREVEAMDGFLSVERFESLYEEGKLLSLQFWHDEAAVEGWRRHLGHRRMMAKGRTVLFRDYRLRIAQVVRDYSKTRRDEAPEDLRAAFG
jgi:heme-degrading monooxygenase HmoA